jgi:hypothetical protein
VSEPALDRAEPTPPRLRAVPPSTEIEVVTPDDPPVLTPGAARVMLTILRKALAQAAVD